MDKKQQQILICTFALQFDDEQLKTEFKAGRLTQEQYLEITDLKREKTIEEIQDELDSLKVGIKQDEEKTEQLEREKKEKREAQVEKINASAEAAKETLKKNKKKYAKATKIFVVLAVLLLIVLGGLKFLATNYLGFTDVDLGAMVFINYDTNAYKADPTFSWNGEYYSDSGYYEDFTKELKLTGLYTDEEIEQLIPKYSSEIYSAIQAIYTGYDLSTEDYLLNGDTIEVTVNYDSDLAKLNKINVVNNKATFEIKGLREQVTSDEITKEALDNVGGIEKLEAAALDAPYQRNSSNYESSIGAVKFLFEDAARTPSVEDLQANSDAYYSTDDFEYMQHVNIAYFINQAYTDDDGDRDEDRDDTYLCSQQLNVYKQGGEVILEDYAEYIDCTSLYDVDSINDAIDQDGSSVGLDGEYTTLEGML